MVKLAYFRPTGHLFLGNLGRFFFLKDKTFRVSLSKIALWCGATMELRGDLLLSD